MTVVRRHFLLEPGEPLLLCRSAIGTAVRFRSFIEASGIPSQAALSTTLGAIPLPIYHDFGLTGRGLARRRWEGTRPDFMWHPLMWLPQRVAHRYTINNPDGTTRLEDDDVWAIRLAFELTSSGLYDPDSGTWLDILSTVDIDVTDELDLARIQDWLDGEPDEVLDDIDLTDHMDIEPSSWAYETAVALRDDLTSASWALIANDLLGLVDDALDPEYDLPHTDLLIALRTVASLGESLLLPVPVEPGTESNEAFFTRLHGVVDLDAEQPDKFVTQDYLSQARQRLDVVRETYWGHLEALKVLDPTSVASPQAAETAEASPLASQEPAQPIPVSAAGPVGAAGATPTTAV